MAARGAPWGGRESDAVRWPREGRREVAARVAPWGGRRRAASSQPASESKSLDRKESNHHVISVCVCVCVYVCVRVCVCVCGIIYCFTHYIGYIISSIYRLLEIPFPPRVSIYSITGNSISPRMEKPKEIWKMLWLAAILNAYWRV